MPPVVLALVFLAALAPPALAGQPLQFLDDRGRKVEAALDVCFHLELRTECLHLDPGQAAAWREGARAVRAEGPEHGPVSLAREGIVRAGEALAVTVPRKAHLVLDNLPLQGVTASFYDRQDPAFRKPVFKTEVRGPGAVRVPAGDFLVSLSAPRSAPDLHFLTAAPGARARLAYRPREGWSLVVRCQDAATGRPVTGAAVRVQAVPGYGTAEARDVPAASDGLAIAAGLRAPLVDASASRPGFVAAGARALSATPGTFAFRTLELEQGGWVRARVTWREQPLPGALCQILRDEAHPAATASRSEAVFEGRTGGDGTCRSGRLARGPYRFRTVRPGSEARRDLPVVVENGEETTVDIALAEIRVEGKVVRGGRAAPGFRVEVYDLAALKPDAAEGDAAAVAAADEEGRYEATLAAPGEYGFLLTDPDGTPAAGLRQVSVGERGEVVDFDLSGARVRGRVVDPEGKPVAAARVFLRWNAAVRLGKTDERGEVEFPLEGEGEGRITVQKEGFRPSKPLDLALADGGEVPPVTIVLERTGRLRGAVVSATGAAVPGAWVATLGKGQGATLFRAAFADREGRFEVERPEGPRVQAFVSGPGCPLVSQEVGSDEAAPVLRCPDRPAALGLTFRGTAGGPIARAAVILRQGETVLPQRVLATHLSSLGLPAESDGGGRLTLAGLAPGPYDVFLAGASSEESIAAGQPQGYLTSIHLSPGNTEELELVHP